MRLTIVVLFLFVIIKPARAQQTLYPGDMAPNALHLEADEFDIFFGGFAMIKKGTAEALINDKGEFVVPYNLYEIRDAYGYNSDMGMSSEPYRGKFYPAYYGSLGQYQNKVDPVKFTPMKEIKTGESVYITPKGNIVRSPNMPWPLYNAYDCDGYLRTKTYREDNTKIEYLKYDGSKIIGRGENSKGKPGQTIRQNYYFVDATWHLSASSYKGFSNNLKPATKALTMQETEMIGNSDKNQRREFYNHQTGFVNRYGEFQVKPDYYKVGQFSEGVAFVCRLNEFDEERWGAIDTLGNLIIPFQYRTQPGRFSHGRALITAHNIDKVEYAFINKKGEIVFTIPKNSGDTISVTQRGKGNPEPESFLFMEGYIPVSISLKDKSKDYDFYLLDTNGVYISVSQVMKTQLNGKYLNIVSQIRDGKFIFSLGLAGGKTGLGMADVTGKILLSPVFNELTLFEKESNLQYAIAWKPGNTFDLGNEGYIDRNGIFQIVKSKPGSGF